ncbi:hypothetical protein HanIR_Chr07g0310191 [Helianthus annuus]|nr:hypothetical protein HanIR_Chr07g0310191 [Helianthus annuus]
MTGWWLNLCKYFSKAFLLCSTKSCLCISWASTTLLSGLGGIINPRYASARRSDSVTTSLNRLRTLNWPPPNSGMLVLLQIR